MKNKSNKTKRAMIPSKPGINPMFPMIGGKSKLTLNSIVGGSKISPLIQPNKANMGALFTVKDNTGLAAAIGVKTPVEKRQPAKPAIKPSIIKKADTKQIKPVKLRPASVEAQKAWQKMPEKVKIELRKQLPDPDRDKVPTGFDCQPMNPKKQESFTEEDESFLSSNQIGLGKQIISGASADTFEVNGNPNLTIKVPVGTITGYAPDNWSDLSEQELETEWQKHEALNSDEQPMMTPTRAVPLEAYSNPDKTVYGLVRPKVTPLWQVPQEQITDELIESIRLNVVALTNNKYVFRGGLKIGIDYTGRPIIFDLNDVRLAQSKYDAMALNNIAWRNLLTQIGRDPDTYPDLQGNVVKVPESYSRELRF